MLANKVYTRWSRVCSIFHGFALEQDIVRRAEQELRLPLEKRAALGLACGVADPEPVERELVESVETADLLRGHLTESCARESIANFA
jgi:hypothetical protein